MRDDGVGVWRNLPQLGPQRLDVRVDRPVERGAGIGPGRRHQLVAVEHAARRGEQRREEPVFVARQVGRPAAVADPTPGFIVRPDKIGGRRRGTGLITASIATYMQGTYKVGWARGKALKVQGASGQLQVSDLTSCLVAQRAYSPKRR